MKGRVPTFEYTEHNVFPTPLFMLYFLDGTVKCYKRWSNYRLFHVGPCQTCMMGLFAKIVNDF